MAYSSQKSVFTVDLSKYHIRKHDRKGRSKKERKTFLGPFKKKDGKRAKP